MESKVGADGMTADEIRAHGELTAVEVKLYFGKTRQTFACFDLDHAIKTLEAIRADRAA